MKVEVKEGIFVFADCEDLSLPPDDKETIEEYLISGLCWVDERHASI